MKKTPFTLTAIAALSLALTGCQAAGTPDQSEATNESAEHSADHAHEITYEGAWAKASDGMTGVFGTISNGTHDDYVLTGASTDAAGLVELHETVADGGQMLMREVEGGFAVPEGADFVLEPGGNHIMLMEMPTALLAGEQFEITLDFESDTGDDISVTVTVDVRDFAGANEEYEHDHDHDESHDH